MAILRIEHHVPDYAAWKQSFDADPLDRKGSGVRRYRVMQAADNPNFVVVDLELDSTEKSHELLTKLHQLWGRVQGEGLIGTPQGRVVVEIETVEL